MTDDERREVAAKLRELAQESARCGDDGVGERACRVLLGPRVDLLDVVDAHFPLAHLADLIEPQERTCHMVFDHLTDTAFCDVCGERFDGVAQYMAMVPNGFSLADYKAKYKDANFCPNCGAKVIQE